MASRAQSKVTTDHEEILQWAEERGAEPACVRGTGGEGEIGILRLEFRGAPGARDESLQPISWDDWFGKFDERGLALLCQDQTARGDSSNFNKIISRETAEARDEGKIKSSRRSSGRRKGTGKRLAVAAAAGRLGSRARRKSTKSASKKASSGNRAASSRKKTTKASSRTRGRKRSTRATASKKSSSSRKTAAKRVNNVRSISGARGSSRSGRTASARGRRGGSSNRRAA